MTAKAIRETEAVFKAEGFTIDRVRPGNGSHKVYYLSHPCGAKTTEVVASLKGDPRTPMNLRSRLRRVIKKWESGACKDARHAP